MPIVHLRTKHNRRVHSVENNRHDHRVYSTQMDYRHDGCVPNIRLHPKAAAMKLSRWLVAVRYRQPSTVFR